MPARRELRFATLDAATADARHLLVAGYARAGHWSLGQVCGHVAEFVRRPLDGFGALPLRVKLAGFLVRNTVGPRLKRDMLTRGGMPAGRPAVRETVMPNTISDVDGLKVMEAEFERLKSFTGTPHDSPMLGPVTNDELLDLTLIHAAHHLSFLVPDDLLQPPTRSR